MPGCSALKDFNQDSKAHIVQKSHHPKTNSFSFQFSKTLRLLSSSDFSRVFDDAPLRVSTPQFLILCKRNNLSNPRLGLVIAKKNCRRAHDRNRIKRHCRETFRTQQHNLPAIDAIVLARRGADTIPPAEINAILNGLWKRLIKRAKSTSAKG